MNLGGIKFQHLVYLFLISSLFLEIQIGDAEVNFGNLILVAGCSVVALLSFQLNSVGDLPRTKIIGQDRIYIAYLLLCFCSVLWSVSRADTILQTIYLAAIWLAVYSLSNIDTRTIVRSIITVAFVAAILSFVAVLVSPSSAFQPHATAGFPELRGIFKHQQRLGLLMSLALGLMVVAWLNGDLPKVVSKQLGRCVLIFLVILTCMIAALARSYTVFMVVALATSILLSRPAKWTLPAILVGIVGTSGLLLFSDQVVGLLGDSESNLTLSGRTTVWERSAILAQLAPWLGHGYASFFAHNFDYIWGAYRPPHAHNSGLQAVFETGFVGLALVLLLVFSQLRGGRVVAKHLQRYSYSLFVVILAVLASTTGVTYAGKPNVLFCILMLLSGVEVREAWQARRRAQTTRARSDVSKRSGRGLLPTGIVTSPANCSSRGLTPSPRSTRVR
jgi:exopolysaccharide production protein ExoQ